VCINEHLFMALFRVVSDKVGTVVFSRFLTNVFAIDKDAVFRTLMTLRALS
jgi:hypothetical protein